MLHDPGHSRISGPLYTNPGCAMGLTGTRQIFGHKQLSTMSFACHVGLFFSGKKQNPVEFESAVPNIVQFCTLFWDEVLPGLLYKETK